MITILKLLGWSVVAGSILFPFAVLAQDEGGNPKPAARAYPPLMDIGQDQNANGTQNDLDALQPDTNPLTGVQSPTLGSLESRHSYWFPGLQYGGIARSSVLYQQAASDWNSTSYIAGNLSLLRAGSRTQLAINYSGGESFSPASAGGNAQFHQFGLVETFDWNRLQMTIIDQFSYLPETQFGFGGATGLSIPGVRGPLGPPLPGLQNGYVPDQSIYTTFGSHYSNTSVAQVTYAITARTSLTAAGSFGILRFVRSGNIENNEATGSLGYNYAVSTKDTVGFDYRFSAYRFLGNPEAIDDHIIRLLYSRRLTGRLALQLFGGPEVTAFRVPIGTSTGTVSGSGGANLLFALSRGSASLAYNHGLSGGGGVFAGANADQVQASLGRQLSRVWGGGLNFGYARNESVGSKMNSQSYNSWYAGASVDRPVGRNARLSLGYSAQIQSSNQPVCAAGTCSTHFVAHQITIGFAWHTRPFVLQ
jgi:hypothetical protein